MIQKVRRIDNQELKNTVGRSPTQGQALAIHKIKLLVGYKKSNKIIKNVYLFLNISIIYIIAQTMSSFLLFILP
jgi:hypothetical protein